MDVYEAIRKRRSIRRYESHGIDDEILLRLLRAACAAPYATGEAYPIRYVVIRNSDVLETLRQHTGDPEYHRYVAKAGAVIAVCLDGKVKGLEVDAACAAENLMLAAVAEGLGSCWVGSFGKASVQEILKLEEGIRPVCLVTLGKPGEAPSGPARPPLEEIVHWID